MDAAAALSGCEGIIEGPAWARLGSLLLLLCGRGAEAVRVLDNITSTLTQTLTLTLTPTPTPTPTPAPTPTLLVALSIAWLIFSCSSILEVKPA